MHTHARRSWSSRLLKQLAVAVDRREYKKGAIISRQGDNTDSIFFLNEGTVTLQKETEMIQFKRWPISKNQWEVHVSVCII